MFKYWSLFLSRESWSKCCEHRSWGLVTFITTLMGCRQTIVVDESNIDFSIIFLLFFNTKFPIFPIFSILSFLFSYFLSIHGAGHPVFLSSRLRFLKLSVFVQFTPELFAESPNRMQLLHQSYLAFFLSVDTKRIFHENKLSKNIEVRHSFSK